MIRRSTGSPFQDVGEERHVFLPARPLSLEPAGTVTPYSNTSTREERLPARASLPAGGGLVFKAHRLLYHSTLGLRVIKKKKKKGEI